MIIQLYIIGVFVSFTFSLAGMVKHRSKERAETTAPDARRRIRRAQAINATGAFCTSIVLATKFLHGAWIFTIAMPLLFFAVQGIRRHYDRVSQESPLPRPPPPSHQPATTRSCWPPRSTLPPCGLSATRAPSARTRSRPSTSPSSRTRTAL